MSGNNQISSDSSNFKTLLRVDTINIFDNKKILFVTDFTVISNKRFSYIKEDSVRKTNFKAFSVNTAHSQLIDKKKRIIYMIDEKKAYYLYGMQKNIPSLAGIYKNDSVSKLTFQKGKDSVQLILDKKIPMQITGMLYIPEKHLAIKSYCSNYKKWNLRIYRKIDGFDFKSIYKKARKECKLIKNTEFNILFEKVIHINEDKR